MSQSASEDSGLRSVAIIGAGIAGLTLARVLYLSGIPCRVFEQAPALREMGAGIQLAPNATRILYRLGHGKPLSELAVRPAAIEMRRWDDARTLGRTELGAQCEKTYGAPYWAVYRPDLQRTLLAALPPETLTLGTRCVGVQEEPDSVVLRFADGTEYTAGMCVGADGIHSVARTALIKDRPRFSGQSIYRGVVPAERVAFLLSPPEIRIWLGPESHFVHYPVAGGRLVSFAATVPGEAEVPESWSATADPAEVAAAYKGWHPEIGAVIAAAGEVHRWALHDRDQEGRWRSRRIALIGDAAHPMLPFMAQGANQAIEDAAMLARCLRDSSAEQPALERYESARRPRVDRVHQISRSNAVTLHLVDGEAQRERDADLRAAQRLENQQWLYGYDVLTA